MGLIEKIFEILAKEKKSYDLPFENNMGGLLQEILPGDVVLISGNSRLSDIIKLVTRSIWSHCALYVGNGNIIEADNLRYDNGNVVHMKKAEVIVSPLEKYRLYNMRVKRPVQLTSEDREIVIAEAYAHKGKGYDQKNLINFLLKEIGLKKFSPFANIGSEDKEEMCSGLIVQSFQTVNYPILPYTAHVRKKDITIKKRNHTQFAPGDFDRASSQFWKTVTFQGIGSDKHYREIQWD